MSVSVVVPILNEETFLPIYLESVTKFAEEVIIVDGGSTDKSIDWINHFQKNFNIKLFERAQTGLPYTDDWNESEVRNFLLDQAKGDWIAAIDVDEIFDDRITGVLPALLNQNSINIFEFPFIDFWKDPWTIRVNAPGDNRWSNSKIRIWRNHIGIRYDNQKHHCWLNQNGQKLDSLPRHFVKDVTLYHYHYAIGRGIKFNDNRRLDVNMIDNNGEPNWNYNHGIYEIKTTPYSGQHPAVIQKYLSQINGQ